MPGQNAEFTFSGSTGQHLNLLATNPAFPNCVDIYLYRPNGTTLGSVATCTSNVVLDRTLDASGTHRIVVRIDGGPWRPATNTPAVDDDLGGRVGLLVVP